MEKPGRPQRNRRHSRRAWPPEDDLHQSRLAKRLFTPEIKRMLKDWLIRRRENPYPSRDEKKRLAIDTGLTYTQICNWFANWRRKLKNSQRERAKKSWGHLIKNYNTNAKGNVEQFSISSEDSIWDEEEHRFRGSLKPSDDEDGGSSSTEPAEPIGSGVSKKHYYEPNYNSCNYYADGPTMTTLVTPCCGHNSISTEALEDVKQQAEKSYSANKAKYKQKIMEKYLRDTYEEKMVLATNVMSVSSGAELSKWLESAAKFMPNKNNYSVDWRWSNKRNKIDRSQAPKQPRQVTLVPPKTHTIEVHYAPHVYDTIHHKDELDAAEALANLAFNCRQRSARTPINVTSS